VALGMVGYLFHGVLRTPTGDKGSKQVHVKELTRKGAMSFLFEEYKFLSVFVILMMAFIVGVLQGTSPPSNANANGGWQTMVCFLIGALLSAAAGFTGMYIATEANVRTMEAAKTGLNNALRVAFAGGSVMGFGVVSYGLLGLSVLFAISAGTQDRAYDAFFFSTRGMPDAVRYLTGFGFGASAIALFARVGGGIYTKAADVGADLVGKVESDIPEDDPRNPASIADQVGDNVGDVAGMGADLFESFVGSIIASASLANNNRMLAFPFWIAGFGVLASVVGHFCVRVSDNANQDQLVSALHRGTYVSSALVVAFAVIVTVILFRGDSDANKFDNDNNFESQAFYFRGNNIFEATFGAGATMQFNTASLDEAGLGDQTSNLDPGNTADVDSAIFEYLLGNIPDTLNAGAINGVPVRGMLESNFGFRYFACIVVGLLCGVLIGEATEYFTSYAHRPTTTLADAGHMGGAATVIIQGTGIGMLSTAPATIFLATTVIGCFELGGVYGISIAAVGMLSTLGVTLATDAYGPIADNAGGIAEMEENAEDIVRERTDLLDALGNTTAATGKGFAIGSAVLTALSLMNAYIEGVEGLERPITTGGVSSNNIIRQGPGLLSIGQPIVMGGILIGAMLPFFFASLTMLSVRKAASSVIKEVQRQFKEFEGLMEGKVSCDAQRCVQMCTRSSVLEMILPGIISIFTPISVGLLVSARCLAGLLIGAISSGFMLAVFMANAGGSWDNGKKYVESSGIYGGKKSETHKGTVVGDTVGGVFSQLPQCCFSFLICFRGSHLG
jgi:Na+/H+-translocating membrane pyrophosphatase